MKLMNLFEIFDPANSEFMSMNWISNLIIFLIIPYNLWIMPNRFLSILIFLNLLIYNEFKNLTKMKYLINILFFFSLLMFLIFVNFLGLFPYIFTNSSHMSFNLMLALSMWIGIIFFCWINYPLQTLMHLIPQNTPVMLMNFMVLIEFISNIIRPWTLSIRLTANMIAGHLLINLLGLFISKFILLLPMTLLIQNLLFMLEFSVSLIQGYVFSILMLLYFMEIN